MDDVNENNAPCLDFACTHTQESISESCLIRLNLDFDYTYPSNFAPNEILFGAKSL